MKTWFMLLALILVLAAVGPVAMASDPGVTAAAEPQTVGSLAWDAPGVYASATLSVSGPDGYMYAADYRSDDPLILSVDGDWPDGAYQYRLDFAAPPVEQLLSAEGAEGAEGRADGATPAEPLSALSGGFSILGGGILTGEVEASTDHDSGAELSDARLAAHVISGDLVVYDSACVGFDCSSSESFGFDTFRLKENNLRIHFDDTSVSGSFPRNDWRITINDSANGGASYFGIDDATYNRSPFRIEAGAPNHALYVDDYGRVGLRTSTPVVELHLSDTDTPTVRLEQNSGGGWTPQTWDVAGNETNFFIRDATNGSKLPFRIRPSAPSSSIFIDTDGDIGFGTASPDEDLDIERTGSDAAVLVQRTDGASGKMIADADSLNIGSTTDHPIEFIQNGAVVAKIANSGRLEIRNGAAAGTLNATATDFRFSALGNTPVSFWINGAKQMELDTSGNLSIRGTLSQNAFGSSGGPRGVVTGVADEDDLRATVEAQEARIAELEARLAELEALVSALAER